MVDRGILVVCGMNGIDNEHTLQVLTKAKELADDSNKELSLLFVGEEKQDDFKIASKYGVDNIIFCECNKELGIWGFSDIVTETIHLQKPDTVLFLADSFGKGVAAVISTRFGAGLTADCIEILYDTETEKFNFLRAALSDSVIAKITCVNCDLQLCTIKKDVFVKKQNCNWKQAQITNLNIDLSNIYSDEKPEILEVTQISETKKIDITKFSVVFCVGRGASSPQNIAVINSLAEKCGACVVGTRAVVEENVIDKEFQVGQSGKSISPKVYVGFGVSGASQHLVGIKNAEIIIAVNKDENAPICQYADYAIIDDVSSVLNEISKSL
ncbi:MAG: electron transfer flavoprotein subunit alpha/FixB family protein [Acutalibacteraceae bacterium]|nr:electron transfer flavoprotein subunit alpha/FixB family protein [Acutalibacteraceae bacterium]